METYIYNPSDKKASSAFLGRVFLYMFIGILITSVVATGLGLAFTQWIFGTLDAAGLYQFDDISAFTVNESAAGALVATMIVSSIVVIIMSFVVNFYFLRNKHSLMVPALIYAIAMGVSLSSFVVFVPWSIIATAFGVTTLIFALMSGIAFLSKGSLNILGIAGIGLFIGSGFLSLIGLIFYLTGWLGAYLSIYWLVSFVSFIAIIFVTIWDLWRIKQISARGEGNDNLALYCAFTLYVDFIYILIRVIYFLLRIYARNK